MASTFEIQKKGATTPQLQAGISQYRYTTNTINVTTHLTSIDGGAAVWQANPTSANAILDIENGSSNTHLASFENTWDTWNPTGEGNSGKTWSLRTGGTPTGGTGPVNAVTGSYYAYTEIDGATNSTFSLEKTISISDRLACIGFCYFMYGSGMGSLYVEVKTGSTWHTLWSRTGQQHAYASAISGKTYQLQPYEPISLYMSNYDGVISAPTVVSEDIISVRFRYVSTASTLGDCALDNVALTYNPFVE